MVKLAENRTPSAVLGRATIDWCFVIFPDPLSILQWANWQKTNATIGWDTVIVIETEKTLLRAVDVNLERCNREFRPLLDALKQTATRPVWRRLIKANVRQGNFWVYGFFEGRSFSDAWAMQDSWSSTKLFFGRRFLFLKRFFLQRKHKLSICQEGLCTLCVLTWFIIVHELVLFFAMMNLLSHESDPSAAAERVASQVSSTIPSYCGTTLNCKKSKTNPACYRNRL